MPQAKAAVRLPHGLLLLGEADPHTSWKSPLPLFRFEEAIDDPRDLYHLRDIRLVGEILLRPVLRPARPATSSPRRKRSMETAASFPAPTAFTIVAGPGHDVPPGKDPAGTFVA